jgi:hypothetical protein
LKEEEDWLFFSTKYETYAGSIANPQGLRKATMPALNANPTSAVSNVIFAMIIPLSRVLSLLCYDL